MLSKLLIAIQHLRITYRELPTVSWGTLLERYSFLSKHLLCYFSIIHLNALLFNSPSFRISCLDGGMLCMCQACHTCVLPHNIFILFIWLSVSHIHHIISFLSLKPGLHSILFFLPSYPNILWSVSWLPPHWLPSLITGMSSYHTLGKNHKQVSHVPGTRRPYQEVERLPTSKGDSEEG